MSSRSHPVRLLFLLVLVAVSLRGNGQTASFTMPSQVCTNVPVMIANTSTGGTSFYWSFCSADLSQTPQALNMGALFAPPREPILGAVC